MGKLQETGFDFLRWDLTTGLAALVSDETGLMDPEDEKELESAIVQHLRSLDPDDLRAVCAEFAREWLSDEAVSIGYGLKNVASFMRWLDENAIHP